MNMRFRYPDNNNRCALATVLICCFAAGMGSACGAKTAGEEIVFKAGVLGSTSSGASLNQGFETYSGWSVELHEAYALFGPVFFYEGQVQEFSFFRNLLIGTANACPAHAQYDSGTLLGEILEQYAVNLLGEGLEFEPVAGFAGISRAMEIHIHPPGKLDFGTGSELPGVLEGESIYMKGIATDEDNTIPFITRMTIPDTGLMRVVESVRVDNIPLHSESINEGTVYVKVLPDMWFASVDFGTLTEMEEEIYLFTEGTQAWTALMRGVRSRYSYDVEWRSK